MDRKHRIFGPTLAAMLVAAAMSASPVGAQSTKEGGSVPPVALELAVTSGSGLVDTFAATVDELSGGQIRIDIDQAGGLEPDVAARVRDGDADLAWVNARGLNGADVHAFDALIAPFLVTDRRLLNEIVTGSIGDDMLAGLADDGLEGLTLLPGEQRFFVGIGHPLATLADFEGARFATIRTPILDRIVEALGGEPVEIAGMGSADYAAQGIDGILTVIDNNALYPDTFMTNNLVPYTPPEIIIANAEVMAELTPEQRTVLRDAAAAMRNQLLAERPDVESSAVRCGFGTSVIEASDADVQAIEAATQPVRDALASDPATAAFIERIETLKAELPVPPWPATCGPAVPPDAAVAGIPDGTYRAIGTRQDSLRTGWESDCDLELVDEHLAWVVAEGGTTWTMVVACGDQGFETGAAGLLEYSDAGDQMTMVEPGYPRGPVWAWSMDDGALTLTMADPGEATEDDLKAMHFIWERTFTMDQPADVLARIPDGRYTAQVTRDDAVRIGFEDDCTLSDQVKTVTLVIDEDQWTELQACGDGPPDIGSAGTLEYEGDRLIKREPGYPGQTTFAWSFEDDTLSLTTLQTDDDPSVIQFLFEHEFERVTS